MLHNDIIHHILSFYPYDKNISQSTLSNNELFQYRKKILTDKANIIKKWWKYYTASSTHYNKYLQYNKVNDSYITASAYLRKIKNMPILSKRMYIHDLIFKYKREHLMSYPEFYLKKIYIKNQRPIPSSLKIYFDKSMNIENRRAYLVYLFLKSPDITFNNLMYVGW